MIRHTFIAYCCCIGIQFAAFAQDKATNKLPFDENAQKFANTIQATDLEKHLTKLASSEFMGRGNGQAGQRIAEKYLVAQFEQLQLQPKGNSGTFSQTVPLVVAKGMTAQLKANGKNYTFLEDFYCFNRSTAMVDAQVDKIVFAGYGIEEGSYNDYKGLDVKGKTVVILNGEPMLNGLCVLSKDGKTTAWSNDRRKKIEIAKSKGVKNLLVITPDIAGKVKQYQNYIMGENMMQLAADVYGTNPKEQITNTFFVSEAIGQQLLGNRLAPLTDMANKGKIKRKKATINTNLSLQVTKKVEEVEVSNVLGFIEGTDKKDEVIVLTAHYDHLGEEHGEVYYGADDDGSGTAALIELAEAFAQAKAAGMAPSRSILIMPVAGEEKGLLGSRYFTDVEPLVPLKDIVTDLNIDMIGRIDDQHKDGNYIYIIGDDKLSSELHNISEAANNAYTKLELDYRYNVENEPNQFYYRSDHYNFAKNGIPIIFYFNGTHADYHKPTDTVEKIDFKAMESRTRLVFYTAWELANRKSRIIVDSNKK
jgi:hypothetical protein